MKKYSDIINDIREAQQEKQQLKSRMEEIENCWKGVHDITDRRMIRKMRLEEYDSVTKQVRDIELSLLYMENNAKLAIANEGLPVLLEILKKYENKPYGEKTSRKIADEMKEKTGFMVYLHNDGYTEDITLYNQRYPGNISTVIIGLKYVPDNQLHILTDNNRIQVNPIDAYTVWYINKTYVEDIPGTVKRLHELHDKAVETEKALTAICDEYNETVVEGINHIYPGKIPNYI